MWRPDALTRGKPKYIAIAEAIAQDIRNGILRSGEQLPPQRELADMLSVNVSTVSRAYNEAERRGLISGTVGRGTFVAADSRVKREMMLPEERESGLIEMGLVLPLYQHDPDLRERFDKLDRKKNLADYLRYTDPAGMPEHREIGAAWVQRFGIEARPEMVTVTAGAQHGLACTVAACFTPGDRIAVDALTYPGLKTLASMLHIHLVPVPMDSEGMIPDDLEIACRRNSVKGVYLMPEVQNPTGRRMGPARREAIASVITRHRLLLIEDDAYCHTVQEPQPALSSLLPDKSVYIAGLSKLLFAGLRTAFVVAAPRLRSRLAGAVMNTLWMAPTLNTAIVCEAIADGTIERIRLEKLKEARARNALAEQFLASPRGKGSESDFFLWHELPEPWTGRAFEEQAAARGINVFCAEKFAVGSFPGPPAVRLSLTGPGTREELAEGLNRLTEILQNGYWSIEGVF